MAGGTGVGGIKDSQGNFEIIGKDSGSVGTRGGTFVMPIGDAIRIRTDERGDRAVQSLQ